MCIRDRISIQQSIIARAGISTIPYEISTPALRDSIGSRSCRDKWRIKLDTANNHVTFEIQDSANAPGYFSSALITGILHDQRTETEEPIKFTFYEARDSQNNLHFIFDVTYPNTHVPVSYTHLDVYKRQFLYLPKEQVHPHNPLYCQFLLEMKLLKSTLLNYHTSCLLYTSRCV